MAGYRFTAQTVNFQGEDGYIVKQYRADGEIATEQFVGADVYEDFCKAIGITPELI